MIIVYYHYSNSMRIVELALDHFYVSEAQADCIIPRKAAFLSTTVLLCSAC